MNHYGVMGYPVAHSKSPLIHQTAFDACGIDANYDLLPVPIGHLQERFNSFLREGYKGMNITLPHKETLLPFLSELTEGAKAIGAVNTIVVRSDNSTLGCNTDADGIIEDLRGKSVSLKGISVAILGAGGAARAVTYGVLQAGCSEVIILNRTLDRARQLAKDFHPLLSNQRLFFYENSSQAYRRASDCQLIINCTSVGLNSEKDLPWDTQVPLSPHHIVYDIVYQPLFTPFLKFAQSYGSRFLTGEGMLLHQAAIAFSLWTGVAFPFSAVKNKLYSFL